MARPVIPSRYWIAAQRLLARISGRAAKQPQLNGLKEQTVKLQNGGHCSSGNLLDEKLNELRRSFEGASELCYLHAELIVKLRRGIDVPTNWDAFTRLWEQETEFLCANLNSRWLISALDTYADYGDPTRQARALIPIAFFNVIRIAQTEHTLGSSGRAGQALELPREYETFELWDGVESYNILRGDMMWNMLERIRRSIGPDRVIAAIFDALLGRALECETMIARISRNSEHPRRERPKHRIH